MLLNCFNYLHSPHIEVCLYELFTVLEFKRNQPVLYWTDSDNNWRSSETFCESKGERLCPGTDLCSPENDPFGAYLYDLKRTPVIDSVNKWLNIGMYRIGR